MALAPQAMLMPREARACLNGPLAEQAQFYIWCSKHHCHNLVQSHNGDVVRYILLACLN